MKYFKTVPIVAAKAINMAALRRYAGGQLHASSTATGVVTMVVDEATDRAELRVLPEYEAFFTTAERNQMKDQPDIPDPILPQGV